MQVNVNIELPEDVSQALQKKWGDLSKRALEALAIDGYGSGALSESQVRRMLRFQTRMEVHEFLKNAGVYFDYTEDDLQQDLETHRKLGIVPAR